MSSLLKQLEILEKEFKSKGKAGKFVIHLLNLTGREINEAPQGTERDFALGVLEDIWKSIEELDLEDTGKHESLCNLINQAISALGKEPIDKEFYDVVFKDGKCNNLKAFEESVRKFRIFCMYYYGNFKFGFRKYHKIKDEKHYDDFKNLWNELHQPKEIQPRPERIGFKTLDTDILWSLGYLAFKYAKTAEIARKRFLPFLKKAKTDRWDSYKIFKEALAEERIDLDYVHDEALLPPEANLYSIFDEIGDFNIRLDNAIKICELNTEERIEEMHRMGRQNTFAYLTMRDLDIYFATSMRKPEHFYNAKRLTTQLFSEGTLSEYNLRVFDPTQAFSHDRLDKGLIECLMIACSKITVYNAQDEDTFGKDAEAAVSLAQGHPVIVYVTRLFPENEKLKVIYDFIDLAPNTDVEMFYEIFDKKEKWDEKVIIELQKEPLSKSRVISVFLQQVLPKILKDMDKDDIRGELINHGYTLSEIIGDDKALIDATTSIITKLENRALIFIEGHPLSLQTSPKDGVARGVIVTRAIQETRDILFKILTNNVEYEIKRDEYCWKLCEVQTGSPIRVITTDPTLSSAYWDRFLEDKRLAF